MQSKEVIANREALLKEKGISIDENILKNAGDAKFDEAVAAAEKPDAKAKERKPREAKVHPQSPKGILLDAVGKLTDTTAGKAYKALQKLYKEKHPLTDTPEGEDSLDVQAHNDLHKALHSK